MSPTLTREEKRDEALRLANEARQHRKQVKRALHARQVTFWEVIEAGDPLTARMSVAEVLSAVPGWGTVKVASALRAAQISPSRKVGAMTERQWGALATAAGVSGRFL